MPGEIYFILQSSRCSELSRSAKTASGMLAYRALRRDYDEQAIIARLMSCPAEVEEIIDLKRAKRVRFRTVHARKMKELIFDDRIKKFAVDVFERGLCRELVRGRGV